MWARRAVVAGTALAGAGMLLDGLHALVVGYPLTTLALGVEGALGAWTVIVAFAGVDPVSSQVGGVVAAWGAVLVVAAVRYAWEGGGAHARRHLLVTSSLGLWYVPVSALLLLPLALLLTPPLAPQQAA